VPIVALNPNVGGGSMTPLQTYAFRVKNGNQPMLGWKRGMGNIVWGSRGMGQYDSIDSDIGDTDVLGVTNPEVPVISPIDFSGLSSLDGDLLNILGGTPTVSTSTGGISSPINFAAVASQTPTQSTTQPTTAQGIASIFSSLASGAAAAEKLYLGAQSPSVVPGTNAIYNPATGQYYNPTTGQVVEPNGLSVGSISTDLTSMLPNLLLIGGIGLGAFLIITALEHAK
jgi:hypothetical protein